MWWKHYTGCVTGNTNAEMLEGVVKGDNLAGSLLESAALWDQPFLVSSTRLLVAENSLPCLWKVKL